MRHVIEVEGALVVLDFDGTLAPIVPTPEQSRLVDGADAAVRALVTAGARVAILTGRPPQDAVALSGLQDLPGLVVLGHYGAERWSADTGFTGPPVHDGVAAARPRVEAVVAAAPTGVRLEDKGRSLAVHTRLADEPDLTLAELRPVLAEIAADVGLELDPGRRVLELRPGGVDKGVALCALARETRPRALLFAGDDLGDLPAYDAVEEVRHDHGIPAIGVAVASEESPPQLLDRADVVVDGPAGLVELLTSLVGERSGR
jgi:trehalose 6-phosphate phosphatase